MIDLNTIISNALVAAVQQAVAPLVERIATLELQRGEMQRTIVTYSERIAALENQAIVTSNAVDARIAALENNPAQGVEPAITIDEARMVEALNSQEWFWSKINDYVERQMDDHLQTYDHDSYDSAVSDFEDMPSLDDYVTRDEVRSEIEDVLNNARLSLSI